MAATSSSRPTSSAAIDGRFPDRRGVRVRAAGRAGTSSAASWTRIRCSSSWSCGRGSSPSSVGELGPDLLVGRQRVRLASGPVLGGDQQLPQALLERVGGDRRLELPDHVAGLPEPQPRPELDLQQRQPGLVEACPVRR